MDKAINRTRVLAEELIGMTFNDLSDADINQLEILIFDQVSVALYGATTDWGTAIRNYSERMNGTGKAQVISSSARTIPAIAALANGAMTHSYELDDTHDESMSHPGSVVIPAAVATAMEHGSSGRELLTAIVAGYEAIARIGAAANAKDVIETGFHPTGIFCGFGGAVAAARLRGLDATQTCHAWGHLLSLASGAMQFADEPSGTAVKRMHAGYAAHNAVLAVEMAAAGIAAPERAIDGRFGFLSLYGENASHDRLTRQPDTPFEIHQISIKPYSCCRLFHSTIDALETVTNGFSTNIADIDRIVVRGPHAHADQHMIRRPTSVMAAQYSLPYIVGATLIAGPQAYDAYGEAHHNDNKILALADKVETRHDAEIEAKFPKHMGSGVDIMMTDGSVRSQTLLDSVGTPGRPMDKQQVMDKGAGLTAAAAPKFNVEGAMRKIEGLKDNNSVSTLACLLEVVLPQEQASRQA
ncbi:MAG: MmgE/PrpD family protein [Pseudomonadota bacterium]